MARDGGLPGEARDLGFAPFRFRPGLRLQILAALAALMLIAFGLLFFAVASLARATVAAAREEGRRAALSYIAGRSSLAGPSATGGAWLASGEPAPLVQLVALYMGTFALALLVFAYFALTRLIVRPVEQLVSAADRVASGARSLRVPRRGPRELLELGASVQAMAHRLLEEEQGLRRKVDELTETTEQLRQAQAHLVRSERMASVGQLAAGLAHEIGNPLAALLGLLDLLIGGGLSEPEQRDFLRRTRSETERIHAVVRDLLEFARPEAALSGRLGSPGVAPEEPAPVASLEAVAADVAALVRVQKVYRGVQLEVDVPAGLAVAIAASKLTQVLLNLLLNAGAAATSSPAGQSRVAVRARAHEGSRVRLEVDDSGPGVEPRVVGRLFEPFVTTKGIGVGLGLGLAVCRGIVEGAGGSIGYEPLDPRGARFYVVLPSAAAGR